MEAVRLGESQRSVARRFSTSLLTVQRWVARAGDRPLHEVDWSDLSSSAHTVANRTPVDVEQHVLDLRSWLKQHSDLGEYGALAIQGEMLGWDIASVPSVRTINRILERHGVFDTKHRVRRPAPPLGWYLPDVAAGRAELDQFDTVSGLIIEGGIEVEVLTGISLHGGLIASWPHLAIKASTVREALVEHWRDFGRPDYVQFDNDTRFQGPHHHKDVIGSVIRLCLSLEVTSVFVPPRETGFQAAIESLNGRWQQKVWDRCHHESFEALKAQSDRYVAAARRKAILRREAAPKRRAFPADWMPGPQRHPIGKIIFLRRTDDHGRVFLLGRTFDVAEHWPHRLVRSDVHLDEGMIRFYALRRADPDNQPLLAETVYRLRDTAEGD